MPSSYSASISTSETITHTVQRNAKYLDTTTVCDMCEYGKQSTIRGDETVSLDISTNNFMQARTKRYKAHVESHSPQQITSSRYAACIDMQRRWEVEVRVAGKDAFSLPA